MDQDTIPAWRVGMSDGCSFLALWLPGDARARWQRKVWGSEALERAGVEHECAYYYGGRRSDRRDADAQLWRAWAEHAGLLWAFRVWLAVRLFSGPRRRIDGVSWAFGGRRFRYSDEPAWPDFDGLDMGDVADGPLWSRAQLGGREAS